jgi:hypothetical protein
MHPSVFGRAVPSASWIGPKGSMAREDFRDMLAEAVDSPAMPILALALGAGLIGFGVEIAFHAVRDERLRHVVSPLRMVDVQRIECLENAP